MAANKVYIVLEHFKHAGIKVSNIVSVFGNEQDAKDIVENLNKHAGTGLPYSYATCFVR